MNTAPLLQSCRGLVLGVSGENSMGYALAKGFVAMGADVAATYRQARRETCAPLLEAAGVRRHFAVDAGDEASIQALTAALGEAWGGSTSSYTRWSTSPPARSHARSSP